MKLHRQILPVFGFLATLGLLFSPLIEVHTSGDIPRNLIIFGTDITGDTQQLSGLIFAQDFQFYSLMALLMSWLAAIFSRKQIRVVALSFGIFIISMLPAWFMVYVEDIIKHQVDGPLEHQYLYGFIFAGIALFCGTFGIIQTQSRPPQPADQILDQGI
jgi:MFS family permease